jgi:hypothetical protein
MREEDSGREFEKALAQYAAVEPREDLEQRVLANLRREETRDGRFEWWRWTAAAFALTAVAAVWAIYLGQRPAPANVTPHIAGHNVAEAGGSVSVGEVRVTKMRDHSESRRVTVRTRQGHGREDERAGVGAAPRLAQFPAPEPLTEQEKLLIRFVEQNPDGAALFAEVRAKELQRESDDMSLPVDGTDLQQRQTY